MVDETQQSLEQQLAYNILRLNGRIRQAVSWVNAIGALTLINAISHLVFKSGLTFPVGLSLGQFMAGISLGIEELTQPQSAWIPIVVGLIAIAVLSAAFLAAGWAIKKFKLRWLLILCIVLYGLDALIALWVEDMIGVIFHGLGVFGMWAGLAPLKEYSSWEPEVIEQAKAMEAIAAAQPDNEPVNAGRVLRVVTIFTIGASIIGLIIYFWIKAVGL